jgi:hypothetical protein
MAVDCVHRVVALSGPGIHLQLCAAQALAASRARGRIAGPRGFLVGHYWSSTEKWGRCRPRTRDAEARGESGQTGGALRSSELEDAPIAGWRARLRRVLLRSLPVAAVLMGLAATGRHGAS